MGKKQEVLKIEKPQFGEIKLKLEGISPLLMNRPIDIFSETKPPKPDKKTFQQMAEEKLYYYNEKRKIYGYPAINFQRSFVEACRQTPGGLKMTAATGGFSVLSSKNKSICELEGATSWNISKMMGWPQGKKKPPVPVIRPEFEKWAVTVRVRWNMALMTSSDLLNLIMFAGECCGVGGNRPNCGGPYGKYKIAATFK